MRTIGIFSETVNPMIHSTLLIWLLLLIPVSAGLVCLVLPSPRAALRTMLGGVLAAAAAGYGIVWMAVREGRLFAASGWLFVDALSAFHLAVMLGVVVLSTAYAWVYFGEELRDNRLTLKQARQFSGLWCGSVSAMSLVLVSNNLGIMWVGIEATTLLTAFLICVHVARESLEAMWKYILICSVGVAFAFMGTLLAAASAQGLGIGASEIMLWTNLRSNAPLLNPMLVKAAFIFLLVGYGTKAGLAPMHNWLPDAHSQAPAPVSALFSGFMLSAALYCVMRFVPIAEAATGGVGWALNLLAGFGLLSIGVAASFILFQKNVKRFLAYSSMEHLGIVALGLGLGGFGTFAALFHTLNHSLGKTLAFFSAGRLGQISGSLDMKKLSGSVRRSPVWGIGLLGGILALIGVAPFALFMSEFQILKAAVDRGSVWVTVLYLTGIAVVFIGALGHAISLAWGKAETESEPVKATWMERLLVFLPLCALVLLGLWMPGPLRTLLSRAAGIVGAAAAKAPLAKGLGQ
jgi:hydrogenase-4 component F